VFVDVHNTIPADGDLDLDRLDLDTVRVGRVRRQGEQRERRDDCE
jgi:hypothetical protein